MEYSPALVLRAWALRSAPVGRYAVTESCLISDFSSSSPHRDPNRATLGCSRYRSSSTLLRMTAVGQGAPALTCYGLGWVSIYKFYSTTSISPSYNTSSTASGLPSPAGECLKWSCTLPIRHYEGAGRPWQAKPALIYYCLGGLSCKR